MSKDFDPNNEGFEQWLSENLERIEKGCLKPHEVAAFIHIEPFAQMLMDNPDKAIERIFEVYNHALDDAYTDTNGKNTRAFIQAVAGGPCEIIPQSIYNAVGAVYPYLERKQKDRALGKVLNILDKLNYLIVNGIHTPGIREPLLLSDIIVVRPLYWPGLDEGRKLLGEYSSFSDLRKEIINEKGLFRKNKVESDFLVAYSLLMSDMGNYGEGYIKVAYPPFLNRTLQGIIAHWFARVNEVNEIEERMKGLQELLPKSIHDKIEYFRQKAEWTDYKKF